MTLKKLTKTIQVKLDPSKEQEELITRFLDEYKILTGFCMDYIDSIYKSYERIDPKDGTCAICKKEAKLARSKDNEQICERCFNQKWSKIGVSAGVWWVCNLSSCSLRRAVCQVSSGVWWVCNCLIKYSQSSLSNLPLKSNNYCIIT